MDSGTLPHLHIVDHRLLINRRRLADPLVDGRVLVRTAVDARHLLGIKHVGRAQPLALQILDKPLTTFSHCQPGIGSHVFAERVEYREHPVGKVLQILR